MDPTLWSGPTSSGMASSPDACARARRRVLAALGAVLALAPACLPQPKKPFVKELVLVDAQPVSGDETEYTFAVVIRNPIQEVEAVVAVATALDEQVTTVVDGESRIDERIPPQTSFESKDTVAIRHRVRDKDEPPYTGGDLRWQVTYQLVGPPPNRAPLAGGGYGRTVQAGTLVALDGSRSGDPDGDPLRYAWSFASAPAGSAAQINPPDGMLASFVPDLPGTYMVQLVVDDGLLASAPWIEGITVLAVDPSPPSVTSHYPESDAAEIPTNAKISAQFSEWLDASTVNAASFTVSGVGGPVAGAVRASAGVAIFEPAAPLQAGRTYRATLAATIADRQGQPLGQAVEWLFSTGSGIDVTGPHVTSFAPASGATGVVPTRHDAIWVEFDEPIDPLSIAGRFSVSQANGTPVPGRLEWAAPRRVRFVPQLPAGQSGANQTWVASVSGAVLDMAGNALAQPASWSFQILPSHAPWLSRGGAGSAGETGSYYAGLPMFTRSHWWVELTGGWWIDGAPGASPTFADWLWDVGWPGGHAQAAFYDGSDLAVGRRVGCFRSSTPAEVPPGLVTGEGWLDSPNAFAGDVQVACFATNHGPSPGDPDHPDPEGALADAVANRGVRSISTISSRYSLPMATETATVSEQSAGTKPPAHSGALQRGDVVTIGPAIGTIWAGDLRFGRNDANGIVGWTCGASCPIPGQRLYGLFVHTPPAQLAGGTPIQGWRFLGTGSLTFEVLGRGDFELRINDDGPGNGDGGFAVPITVQRANAVSFAVYVPDGTGAYRLARTANLDGEGPKAVPQACIACHGGTWDADTQTVRGASLLPIDPSRLDFSSAPGATRAAQEDSIRLLNVLVSDAQRHRPNEAKPIREWLDGAYANRLTSYGQAADDAFVPAGWSGDAALYQGVAKPYCLSCHQALNAGIDFDSAAEFRALGATIQHDVCVERSMPHASPTFEAFWRGNAPAQLSAALFGGAHCGP